MIIFKSIAAIISFLFSFIGVACIVGGILVFSLKPDPTTPGFIYEIIDIHAGITWRTLKGDIFIGAGTEWWNIPGTLIGVFAGIHSAKAPFKKQNKNSNNS